jgi:hypothetical protein
LLTVWLLFLGAYLLARVTLWLVRRSTVVGTARLFVLSLVPICLRHAACSGPDQSYSRLG